MLKQKKNEMFNIKQPTVTSLSSKAVSATMIRLLNRLEQTKLTKIYTLQTHTQRISYVEVLEIALNL